MTDKPDVMIAQDNRLTTARYELSLIEKRVFYYIIKEIRKNHMDMQRTLFDDIELSVKISKLSKEINQADNSKETKKALRALRKRSFEYGDLDAIEDYNDDDIDMDNYVDDGSPPDWFEVGFINWSKIKGGVATVQVSKMLMPFLVELSSQFTPFSLNIAMSLKSKWSQRMYELCQKWQGTNGFRMKVKEMREAFKLEDKYSRYALFKNRVIEVAYKELKELYETGQCDVYFEYSEERNGRTVETLRFKLIRKNELNVKTTHDMLLELIPVFEKLYQTKKQPKNESFIKKVIILLQKYPNLIEPLYTRIRDILKEGVKEDTARYIRFILNEDVLGYKHDEKKVGKQQKKKEAKKEEKKEAEADNVMQHILGLSEKKKTNG